MLRSLRAHAAPGVDLQALDIRVEIALEAGGFRLHLTIGAPSGRIEQNLFATECETFMELVALEAELAAAPIVLARRVTSARTPSAPSDTGEVPARPALQVRLRAGVEGWAGLWPRFAPGLQLSLGVNWRRLRVEAGFHQLLPQQLRYAQLPNVGGRVRMATGHLQLCGVTWVGPVQLANCGLFEAGAMRADGRGVEASRASVQGTLALGVALGVRYPRHTRAALWVSLEGLLQLRRTHYHVRGLPELFRSDRGQFRGGVGIDVALR